MRAGCRTAKDWATRPPIENPTTWAARTPAASRTAATSSARSAIECPPGDGGVDPAPLRSMRSSRNCACQSAASAAQKPMSPPSPCSRTTGGPAPASAQCTGPAGPVAKARLSSGTAQPGVLIPDPESEQATEVGDELVVFVRGKAGPDRLHQQVIEIGAPDPVENDFVDVGQAGRAEVLVALGLEVGVGQLAVDAELVVVGKAGVVSDF